METDSTDRLELFHSLAVLVLYDLQVDIVDPRSFVWLQMFDSQYNLLIVDVPDRLASALGAQRRSFTLLVFFLVNAMSASGNLLLLINWAAMASAIMEHGVGFVAWSVSLLTVCNA